VEPAADISRCGGPGQRHHGQPWTVGRTPSKRVGGDPPRGPAAALSL